MKAKFDKLMILAVVLVMVTNIANAELVAHWKLDETSGNIAADSSDNANNGTLYGEPVWTAGKIDGAFKFDGVDDYVDLPIGSLIGSLTNCTFAAWVNWSTQGDTWQRVFDFGSGTEINMFLTPNRGGDDTKAPRFVITTGGVNAEDQATAPSTLGSGWHHVAVTIDADNNTILLYLDAKVIAKNTAATLKPSDLGNTTYNWLGRSQYAWDPYFNGSLDDFRIYNHALSTNEVTGLFCWSLFPPSHILLQTVRDAEVILKKKSPKRALAFIEEKIAEYKRWTKTDDSGLAQKVLSSELYFLLAEAEETAAVPKEDVVSAYKRAVESGGLLPPRLGSVLIWLYENVDIEDYEDIVQSFIENNSNYLREAAKKAEMMVRQQKSKAAVRFLEDNLTSYAHWREKHPYDDVSAEHALPEIYFWLAKAKEAGGAPKKEITDAYSKAFKPLQFAYVPEQSAALIWLFENGCTNEYREIIKSFTQSRDVEDHFTHVVRKICKDFESKKDWDFFERFLNTLFAEAKYPYDWAMVVESCLNDKTNRWAKAYFNYLNTKPAIKFGRDCKAAEQYMADGNFKKAAELYQDIVSRCGPEDDKGAFEFQLCKCLFEGGQYREAIAKFESFIANNKAMHKSLVKEAMLMKGRAHIQLAEIDKAIDAFLTLMIEHPETKKAPETSFFIGYCYMLQGKFEQAREALNLVVKDYPENSYANRASICLNRIKNMTN